MAIYLVRYNLHCDGIQLHEANVAILEAASEEEARKEVITTRLEKHLGDEKLESHPAQTDVLSVREIKDFLLWGTLRQGEKSYLDVDWELPHEDMMEILKNEFPEYNRASEIADDVWEGPSRPSAYAELHALGAEKELKRTA